MEKYGTDNPPSCPYCTRRARLVGASVVYRGFSRGIDGLFWYCSCGAWVGTHKNSKRHAPLGTLANAELRRARQTVHAMLDPLWQSGCYPTRRLTYEALAQKMGRESVHVGCMTIEDCAAAVVVLGVLEQQIKTRIVKALCDLRVPEVQACRAE